MGMVKQQLVNLHQTNGKETDLVEMLEAGSAIVVVLDAESVVFILQRNFLKLNETLLELSDNPNVNEASILYFCSTPHWPTCLQQSRHHPTANSNQVIWLQR